MTDRSSSRKMPRKRPLDGTLRQSSAPPPWVIIGYAHVVLGAFFVFSAVNTFVFGSNMQAPIGAVIVFAMQGLLGAALVLSGLWLTDGRKRGAVIACAIDAMLAALSLFGRDGFSFDLLIMGGLAAAALWVMPTLPESNHRA